MKLIVAGSTGFVATEIIRQALANPAITTIVALARRETVLDAGVDTSKLRSVIVTDFDNYSDEVKRELENADACIWTIAVTPSGLKTMTLDEVGKICYNYTVTGIETMASLASKEKPFRFVYISGANGERDQTKRPYIMRDYALIRGKAESAVLNYAENSKGTVVACIAKPGLVDAPGRMSMAKSLLLTVVRTIVGFGKVDVSEISATLLHQVVNGFEKDTLSNDDLVRIGSKVLEQQKKALS